MSTNYSSLPFFVSVGDVSVEDEDALFPRFEFDSREDEDCRFPIKLKSAKQISNLVKPGQFVLSLIRVKMKVL